MRSAHIYGTSRRSSSKPRRQCRTGWARLRASISKRRAVGKRNHMVFRVKSASPIYLQDWGGLQGTGGDSRGIESSW
jgi:hypothetical protein